MRNHAATGLVFIVLQHALRSEEGDAFQLLKQFSAELRSDREVVLVRLTIDLLSNAVLIAAVHTSHIVYNCMMLDCSGKRRFVLDARQR